MKNRPWVILGSSGFVGQNLIQDANKNSISFKALNSKELNLISENASDQLAQVLSPDSILFLVYRIRNSDSAQDLMLKEIKAGLTIAQALTKSKVHKCIYLSTLSVYSDLNSNLAITEDTPADPNSFYGIAKLAVEELLRLVCKVQNIPLVILRSCKIYGAGDPDKQYGPVRFIDQFLNQQKVEIYGEGDELRDHIYVQDVVNVLTDFGNSSIAGTFNLANGESATYQDVLDKIRQISGQTISVKSKPRSKPKIDQVIKIDQLLKVIPNLKLTSLDEGIKKTYQQMKEVYGTEKVNYGRS